jgi:hypothetical protein
MYFYQSVAQTEQVLQVVGRKTLADGQTYNLISVTRDNYSHDNSGATRGGI